MEFIEEDRGTSERPSRVVVLLINGNKRGRRKPQREGKFEDGSGKKNDERQ
jgi:hypothetical protein